MNRSMFVLFVVISIGLQAETWDRFRGPNGTGVNSQAVGTPTKWSPTENIKWKTNLPGPGSSSPIIVGDRVFVTCWSGYGTNRNDPGRQEDLRRHLVCLDRTTGEIQWKTSVEPVLPEDRYGGMFAEHGYASHTPVSDGEHVYAYFGKSGAIAYDFQGKKIWQTIVGEELDPRNWGSASSPILYKDLLIVTASAESEALVALDKKTGKQVWKQEAKGLNSTWGTPILVPVDGERTDLVIGVPYEIWGFDPETGKLRWYCTAMDTDSYCSSVVADQGIVFGVEGRGGGSIAVRAGGKGDVTKTHVVWQGRENNRIGTPIIFQGRLYSFGGRMVTCVQCSNGERVFQSRLSGGESGAVGGGAGGGNRGGRGGGGMGGDYASPVIADGKIFFQTRSGDMHVLKASDRFEPLSVNRVTTDTEDFSATPAVVNGQIFIRSSKNLYCVGT